MRAGFKRSRTRARAFILFTFVLFVGASSISRKVGETFPPRKERRANFSKNLFFFFPSTIDLDDLERERKWRGTNLVWHKVGCDCSLPPPLPSPLLPWKTEALSLSPPSHRDNDIGERASPPPPPVHPFLSSSSSSVGALGPLRPLAAALFPIRLLDYLRAFGGSGQGPMMRSGIEYRLAL